VTLGSPAECAERRVIGLARFRDPAGCAHEVFHGATVIANSFQDVNRAYALLGGMAVGLWVGRIPRVLWDQMRSKPKQL
jgi:hypothetical protein